MQYILRHTARCFGLGFFFTFGCDARNDGRTNGRTNGRKARKYIRMHVQLRKETSRSWPLSWYKNECIPFQTQNYSKDYLYIFYLSFEFLDLSSKFFGLLNIMPLCLSLAVQNLQQMEMFLFQLFLLFKHFTVAEMFTKNNENSYFHYQVMILVKWQFL